MSRKGPPPPSDPDQGIWQGTSVARCFTSPDGMAVLVGRSARDNDVLTFKLASAKDFWMHVSGHSGSHVVVRNPENLERLPRETQRFAAALAARHSAARRGGRVSVHICRCSEVKKGRGMAPGKVTLGRYTSVRVSPADDAAADEPPDS